MNNLSQEQILTKAVMSRIQAIHFMRYYLYGPIGKLTALVIAFSVIILSVSIKNILINMPNPVNIHYFLSFMAEAFIQTEFLIKTLVIIISTLAVFLIKDILNFLIFSQNRTWSNHQLEVSE